uniref:Putative disease resistance protein n=1 Tax=Noccaea caerulescens TaxID=107243 RepID=A0A1J3JZI7_NOCCA
MDSSVSTRAMKQKQYDVFLSFRGKDTRRGIVSHLHNALLDMRLDDIFKDDEALEIGDSISDEIKNAIRSSKFAIVVISENFVSSTWCLNELQMIMELHNKQQLIAVPIFYDVDPSHVKHQRGTFSLKRYKGSRIMQFFTRKKRKTAAQVRKWREALTQVGGTSGKDSRACEDEAMMVDDIVKYIARELSSMQPLQMDDLFGMDAHMEQIDPLLGMDSTTDEVRMIGIWGMRGIGKTTIAKYLYNKYSPRFGRRFCFIKNVSISAKNGLPGLQKELLSKILGKKQATILSEEQGCTTIKSKLKKLKVLIVLDDVDKVDQLRALAKETSWFGPGSRIIVTTRDLGLLYFYEQIFVHHVNFLGNDDSIRVVKHVAFYGGPAPSPSDVYEQLSIRASKIAQGLPLALDAFGTYLRRMKSIEEWENALDVLEKFACDNIMDILTISYEGLDKRDQAVFLHVACLFNGDAVQRVTTLIDHGDIRIKGLEEKSLIDISPDGCITIHVLVEQAAREIVRQESRHKPWRQRILWEHEQIVEVLQNTTGTATVEGVTLNMSEMLGMVFIEGGNLNAINNLKFFKAIKHLNDMESKLQFLAGIDKLPKTLRLLHWDAYPMETLPSEYYPSCLVELNLRYSNLRRLWDGTPGIDQLRRLDVTGSKNLTEVPDLSRATLLEELIMKSCKRLEQTPESIGGLSTLRKLDLSNCDGLMNLQIHVSENTVLPGR